MGDYNQSRSWENPRKSIVMRLYSNHKHEHRLMIYKDDHLVMQKYYTDRDEEAQNDVAALRVLLECNEENHGQRL